MGGLMLMAAVAAIVVICLWANKYDDLADDAPRPPPLALRDIPPPKDNRPRTVADRAVKPRGAPPRRREKWRPKRRWEDDIAAVEAEILAEQAARRGVDPLEADHRSS